MKKIQKTWITAMVILCIQLHVSHAQTVNEDRMKRDVEVAENVLATLIKQEMEQQKTFFGLDVKGTYQPGYGVTFRVPSDHNMPFVVTYAPGVELQAADVVSDGNTIRYTIRSNGEPQEETSEEKLLKLKDKNKEKKRLSADSARAGYNDRIIRAAQNFILDYGDFISQLAPHERIVVTNRNDQATFYFNAGKRTRISVEGLRSDITAFKQGQLTREEAMKKLTVINTESVDTREPDMEMLSSIFSRLYRPDLSKTFFLEGNVYYERLRDFGSIFYMRVVSSEEPVLGHFNMPTLGLQNLDQQTRDKKVKELYPAFERDMKENILQYGRTVRSLKDTESLIFNVQMTRCKGCGIPNSMELSIKSSVLKDLDAGKIDRNAAMSKIEVKKGANQ